MQADRPTVDGAPFRRTPFNGGIQFRGRVEFNTPPPRFGDPVSPDQPDTLARISGFLIVVIKKTIC